MNRKVRSPFPPVPPNAKGKVKAELQIYEQRINYKRYTD